MRDYQREKNNPYWLPTDLYRQTLYLVRDYKRLKQEHTDIILSTNAQQEGRSSLPTDPTCQIAMRLENIFERISAVEKAFNIIPEEYQNGIYKNITEFEAYPLDAGRNTYGRWKARFIFQVARNMHWI